MLCQILKDFSFSRDGFTTEPAQKGESLDIPDDLVSGLERGGMVAPTKALAAAPETAAAVALPHEVADDDMAALRQEYRSKVGKRPFNGWGADELRRRIAEASE